MVPFSVAIVLVAVLFAGAVAVPVAAQAADTIQFHYNAQLTGDYTPVAGPAPSNGLLKWNFTTGSVVESSPAVANSVVYVGSDDGNLYALNANNGTKIWNYTTGADVLSSPAVANGVVYVGSNDTNLYVLNANNGTKLWNYTTKSVVGSSPAVVTSSPAVANGVVYVGSEDNNVYAIGNAAAATSQGTPGFEVTLALVGLVIVAYVVRRRG
jgi:PGF-CTERM protein